jgi:hypothetical protein
VAESEPAAPCAVLLNVGAAVVIGKPVVV